MLTIGFVGAKGGVGTTTVAACTGLAFANLGKRCHIVSRDGDAGSILDSSDLLTVSAQPAPEDVDCVIHDLGTTVDPDITVDWLYLVARNCYLAYRHAVATPFHADGLILLVDKERTLTVDDAAALTGLRIVTTLAVDRAVGRAVDCGLLSTMATRMINQLATSVAAQHTGTAK